ncbi:MAG: 30S ribosomal protein THX [Saprospirales bacterium]|jgi:30S ribosomal protein S31|nr:30S ribosomal protein THX [Saprospirales bacterium]
MGRGDKRTRKGKIFTGSFGNSRPHKLEKPVNVVKEKVAKEEKAAPKKAATKKAAAKKEETSTEEV